MERQRDTAGIVTSHSKFCLRPVVKMPAAKELRTDFALLPGSSDSSIVKADAVAQRPYACKRRLITLRYLTNTTIRFPPSLRIQPARTRSQVTSIVSCIFSFRHSAYSLTARLQYHLQRYLLYSALGYDWATLVAKLLSITDSAYELATYLAEVTTAASLPRGSIIPPGVGCT